MTIRKYFTVLAVLSVLIVSVYLFWTWYYPINRIRGPELSKYYIDRLRFSDSQRLILTTKLPYFNIVKNNLFKSLNKKVKSIKQISSGHRFVPADTRETEIKPTNETKTCVDVLCTQYLSKREIHDFNLCRLRTSKRLTSKQAKAAKNTLDHMANSYNVSVDNDLLTSGRCHFMNGTGVTGLVSFPGSGNTWVRELLQTVTGVCTGSVYCDVSLRSSGFDGEGVQSSSVLVVKQHTPMPKWTTVKNQAQYDPKLGRPYYDQVILVVRNPFHALVSEWNRQLSSVHGLHGNTNSSHTDFFGPEYFGFDKKWDYFIRDRLPKWEKEFDWMLGYPDDHGVLLVRYEDLAQDVIKETKRMLDFLLFPVNEDVISTKLAEGHFSFHRKSSRNFNPFTPGQEELITNAIKSVTDRVDETTCIFLMVLKTPSNPRFCEWLHVLKPFNVVSVA